MTSIQGTNTDFSSIANNWLYLNTDGCDKDYLTNVSVNFFKYMGNVDEPDTVSIQKRKEVLNKYLSMENTIDTLSEYKDKNYSGIKPTKVYDLLQILNQKYGGNLSQFISIVDQTKFKDILENNYNGTTFFVYKNDYASNIKQWLIDLNPTDWTPSNRSLDFQYRFLRELLKYHTLNFKLYPSQLVGKKVQLATQISDSISTFNKIEIEDVNGKLYINLNQEYELEYGVGYYPDYINRILIEKVVACDDGLIYIIEKPLIPTVI